MRELPAREHFAAAAAPAGGSCGGVLPWRVRAWRPQSTGPEPCVPRMFGQAEAQNLEHSYPPDELIPGGGKSVLAVWKDLEGTGLREGYCGDPRCRADSCGGAGVC